MSLKREKNDPLGSRMKMYEKNATQRFIPLIPIVARLDGKKFSNFTKGLQRPYDPSMSELMQVLTKYLVEETGASMGYTQSDEITLTWYSDSVKRQVFFDGKIQKMISILASMASAKFNKLLPTMLPEKADQLPLFDCRVWQVPNKGEAVNAFLWREQDATKNSISMAASQYYNHKELHKCGGTTKQEMLLRKGINWNDYPAYFKRGCFCQRAVVSKKFTPTELSKLPPKHAARKNPDLCVTRTIVRFIDMPPFGRVINKKEVIYDGALPTTD